MSYTLMTAAAPLLMACSCAMQVLVLNIRALDSDATHMTFGRSSPPARPYWYTNHYQIEQQIKLLLDSPPPGTVG
jgi:hypothetical protein